MPQFNAEGRMEMRKLSERATAGSVTTLSFVVEVLEEAVLRAGAHKVETIGSEFMAVSRSCWRAFCVKMSASLCGYVHARLKVFLPVSISPCLSCWQCVCVPGLNCVPRLLVCDVPQYLSCVRVRSCVCMSLCASLDVSFEDTYVCTCL